MAVRLAEGKARHTLLEHVRLGLERMMLAGQTMWL